jgi:hypothetical protein
MKNTVDELVASLLKHNPLRYTAGTPFKPSSAEQDAIRILQFQEINFNLPEPIEGDLVEAPDGSLRRIAHVHHHKGNITEWQPSTPAFFTGSYFMGKGCSSFSGSLDRVKTSHLEPTNRSSLVFCWTWHHGHVGAHQGVHFLVNTRIWKEHDNTDV